MWSLATICRRPLDKIWKNCILLFLLLCVHCMQTCPKRRTTASIRRNRVNLVHSLDKHVSCDLALQWSLVSYIAFWEPNHLVLHTPFSSAVYDAIEKHKPICPVARAKTCNCGDARENKSLSDLPKCHHNCLFYYDKAAPTRSPAELIKQLAAWINNRSVFSDHLGVPNRPFTCRPCSCVNKTNEGRQSE